MLRTRVDFFDSCVASAVEYLRALWPDELATVRFEVAGVPAGRAWARTASTAGGSSARERRVVLYRVPIERLVHLHRDDDWHRRSFIESCVFRAVAELLGKDPWDIAPGAVPALLTVYGRTTMGPSACRGGSHGVAGEPPGGREGHADVHARRHP